MRICILTQPLHTNYGGLIQNYALQQVLKNMGHQVWTENRQIKDNPMIRISRRLIRKVLGLCPFLPMFPKVFYPTANEESQIMGPIRDFIKKNITTTTPIYSTNKKELRGYDFNAFIVGSDQVWRPRYSPGISNYFLDFTEKQAVKRIAYAASFGTSEWEFTPDQTQKCGELLRKFDAISVREDSGIDLCKHYFHTTAKLVLDPTLLLDKKDYLQLIEKDNLTSNNKKLFTYILNPTKEKERIIAKCASSLKLEPFEVKAKCEFYKVGTQKLQQCIIPSVTTWLKGFKDAEFIVTDSFHGTVFSIIFNKPFIAIGNKSRGLDRFISLLKMFSLEERLILSENELTDCLISKRIDYNTVNELKSRLRQDSLSFLASSLAN